ncbi:MFS transporter [Arenibaculum pallidiluteum]|uniref:MFS transporter n=1 Tax=Arenibaculum pallidiluteum TaxID=2812559 RepID=UPI001A977FBB|nr:MFS transporter [Arenibaculum pallidiluteum]
MLDRIRLSAFFAAVFSVIAVQLPYWPVWLTAQGLEPAEVGLIVSLAYWTKPVADPLAGLVADRTGSRRRAMVVLAVAALAGASLFLVDRGLPVLLVVSALWTGAFSALVPLGDSLALLATRARGFDYGRLRVWGSIGFVVTTMSAGPLLAGSGSEAILHLLLAGLGLALLTCLLLPEAPAPAARAERVSLAPLLRRPTFLVFLVTAAVLQPSHAVLYAFGTIHWRSLGLSSEVVGLLWVEGVLVEIALFAFGRRLADRLGPEGLLMAAAAAGIVRWTALAWAESLPAIAAAQALHGLTFGAAHLGAMRFLQEAVPRSHAATGQTLYSGVALGVGFGSLLAASGPLYEVAGGRAFLAMAALCLAAGTGAAVLLRMRRAGKTAEVPGAG